MIQKQGVTYRDYECESKDGIILQLHRLSTADSFDVVYFQHGVCDTSQAWIIQGGKGSAMQAHQLGFDVFMGNFRGVAPRKMTKWREEQGPSYWNYNIDHLGQYDIDAFVSKIIDVKSEELSNLFKISKEAAKDKIRITYIGHSMGGMTLPIYLISKAR